VPQTRVRLIAATPSLLAALLRKACKANVRTTRDVISKPRGTHVRSGRSIVQVRKRLNRKKGETMWINARAGWEDWCTSIDKPAPTVRARHTHAWVTLKDGKATHHCRMSAQDLAALQTFPPDYQLPERKQEACLQVGNAVPPLLAQRLLESVV
jgi:site-specific DNA-cytosine methylase